MVNVACLREHIRCLIKELMLAQRDPAGRHWGDDALVADMQKEVAAYRELERTASGEGQ